MVRLLRVGGVAGLRMIGSHPTFPSTAPSDLAQQRDAEDVLQQKRDGADG